MNFTIGSYVKVVNFNNLRQREIKSFGTVLKTEQDGDDVYYLIEFDVEHKWMHGGGVRKSNRCWWFKGVNLAPAIMENV